MDNTLAAREQAQVWQTENSPAPAAGKEGGGGEYDIRAYKGRDINQLPEKYRADPRLIVEMSYKGKGVSGTNAAGWARDSRKFFRELVKKNPELWSEANLTRVRKGYTPIVDDVFIENFPQYDGYTKNSLIHHHIGGGGQAMALPESLHEGFGGIHEYEKMYGIWDNDIPGIDKLYWYEGVDDMISQEAYRKHWNTNEIQLVRLNELTMSSINIIDEQKDFLQNVGLPESAPPYITFRALSSVELKKLSIPTGFLNIGLTGNGDYICIKDRSGEILVIDHEDYTRMSFMNSSLFQMLEYIIVYDSFIEKINSINGDDAYLDSNAPADTLAQLKKSLYEIDKMVFKVNGFWSEELGQYEK